MIYQQFLSNKKQGKKSLAILLDPDKIKMKKLDKTVNNIEKLEADYIFVGGSLLSENYIDNLILKIKKFTKIPVILFPGNYSQISSKADGILFLSLLSGRNPEYLIGQHIQAAPILKKINLEIISTGYLLIENGKITGVEYISNTKPIPRDKPDIALATALAGQMLGMKTIYLEAGSGAIKHVPEKLIKILSENIEIPIIVGGGIKTKKQIQKIFEAGADIVVVGTAFEKGNI